MHEERSVIQTLQVIRVRFIYIYIYISKRSKAMARKTNSIGRHKGHGQIQNRNSYLVIINLFTSVAFI